MSDEQLGDEAAPDGVISLAEAADARRGLTVRRGPRAFLGECEHRASEVCERMRRVTCKACGEVLDPVTVLIDFAYYLGRLRNRIAKVEAWEADRREEHQAELDAKAERRNAVRQLAWCTEHRASVTWVAIGAAGAAEDEAKRRCRLQLPDGREAVAATLAEAIRKVTSAVPPIHAPTLGV